MKFMMGLLLIASFGLNAQAKGSEYSCEFSKFLQVGEEFENINDFLFVDYPYLLINGDDKKITEVSIGALSYDGSEFEFSRASTASETVINVTRLAEEGYPAYKALSVIFPHDGSKTAVVISHEEELEGPVAQFKNCK